MAKAYLKEILQLTIEKFKQNGTFDLDENEILEKEYQEVEQVLPAPGQGCLIHKSRGKVSLKCIHYKRRAFCIFTLAVPKQ